VAHDSHKDDLVEWCNRWKGVLEQHELIGTGTTAQKYTSECGLRVEQLQSGPFGGDQQIGARIAECSCHMLIFFWDPIQAMAHAEDVKALMRIATLYNILVASNTTTADILISSQDFGKELNVKLPNVEKYIQRDIARI